MHTPDTFAYEVALSFAGEDRPYVAQVAELLAKEGVRVFYDEYEQVTLWGKDLYVHLRDIYQRQARFTVLFASCHYARKVWTNHERESAQARAISERAEYILPARFDDSEIPGLLATTGYIDLRTVSPAECVSLILQKLGRGVGNWEAPAASALPGEDVPKGQSLRSLTLALASAAAAKDLNQQFMASEAGVAAADAEASALFRRVRSELEELKKFAPMLEADSGVDAGAVLYVRSSRASLTMHWGRDNPKSLRDAELFVQEFDRAYSPGARRVEPERVASWVFDRDATGAVGWREVRSGVVLSTKQVADRYLSIVVRRNLET